MGKPAISAMTIAALAGAVADGATLNVAATKVGVSSSTAYKYRDEIEAAAEIIKRDRTASASRAVSSDILLDSHRNTLRRVIARLETTSVPDLIKALREELHVGDKGKYVALENLVIMLWSLQKQGEVSLTLSSHTPSGKHGPSDNAIKTVHAQETLYRNLGLPVPGNGARGPKPWPPIVPGPRGVTVHPVGHDMTKPSQHGVVAQGGPVETRRVVDRPIPDVAVVTPMTDEVHPVGVDLTDHHAQPEVAPVQPWQERYPVLGRVLAKAAERAEAQKRAEGYLAAAALLEALDSFESAHLSEKAEIEVKEYTLTPVEIEYLAFVDDHTCDDCGRFVGEGHDPNVEH